MESTGSGPDKFERVALAIARGSFEALVPGGGVLIAAYQALFDHNFATDFNRRVRDDLQDQVDELQEAVRRLQAVLDKHGRKLDELDPIAYRRVMEEFVKSILNSTTDVQRRAIVAATARLFDPELGPLALRHQWLQVVRSLSDAEIEVLQLIRPGAIWIGGSDHVVVGALHGVTQYNNADLSVERGAATSVPMHAANIAASRTILFQLQKREPSVVEAATEYSGSPLGGHVFRVAPAGEMLLTLIEDVPDVPATPSSDSL